MKNELISVIVPIYNVEDYLDDCIKSILNQTYENIELILINDGSTDNCEAICKKYEKNDKRVKYYFKENGGLSSARNYGIEKSNGKYYMFIDSDDYIDSDMVEKLYDAIVKNKVDIACCGKYLEYKNETILVNSKGDFFCDNIESLRRILRIDNIDTSCCDKLFDSKLFQNIRFPEGRLFEDLGTLYKIIDISNGLYHIHFPLYHYRKHDNSIINSKFNPKKLDSIYFRKEIHEFVLKKYPQLKSDSELFYFPILINDTFKCYALKLNNEYEIFKNEIKKYICDILFSKICFKFKMKALLIYFNISPIAYFIKAKLLKKNYN